MSLDIAIKTLDELEREIDTVIRVEFSECSDRLDDVILLIRTTDRSDVARLTSQMGRMQAIMKRGALCTCTAEARWHACLGRLSTAVEHAAMRYNMESVKIFCEQEGIPFDSIMEAMKMLAPENQQSTDELPPIPDHIQIPDDLRGLKS